MCCSCPGVGGGRGEGGLEGEGASWDEEAAVEGVWIRGW